MMHLRTAAAILVLSATVLSAAGCTNKPGSDGPSPLGLASSSPDEGHTNGPTGPPVVIGMWIGYTDLESTVLRITVSYPNAMDDGEKGSGAGVFSRAVASVKVDY